MTYLNFTYDSMGTQQGMAKVRQLATLSADGLTYKGGGDFAYLDSQGNVLLAGKFTITSTRLQAQAPQPITSAQTIAQQLRAY